MGEYTLPHTYMDSGLRTDKSAEHTAFPVEEVSKPELQRGTIVDKFEDHRGRKIISVAIRGPKGVDVLNFSEEEYNGIMRGDS